MTSAVQRTLQSPPQPAVQALNPMVRAQPQSATRPDEPGQEVAGDKSVTKLSAFTAPKGPQGEKYLASGKRMGMRLWESEAPSAGPKAVSVRDYEVLGFVISGRAELHLEGQIILLEPGDSWLVPPNSHHSYRILETFTAVEATAPPSFMHARDEPARPQQAPPGGAGGVRQ